jgi:hypothetical protein
VSALAFLAILFLTIGTSLALGIAAAYGTITGILSLLSPGRRPSTPLRPILVPSQTHASGD